MKRLILSLSLLSIIFSPPLLGNENPNQDPKPPKTKLNLTNGSVVRGTLFQVDDETIGLVKVNGAPLTDTLYYPLKEIELIKVKHPESSVVGVFTGLGVLLGFVIVYIYSPKMKLRQNRST